MVPKGSSTWKESRAVFQINLIMCSDLQPDGLTAGLAGHCQLEQNYPEPQKEKEMICASALKEKTSHSQL